MTRTRVRYLLAVEGGRVLGLVSIGDLVKARLESTELEARVLRDRAPFPSRGRCKTCLA
jgi:signal-transduction protein with cAMP-binding, CBS, and nucleotidyltransferase domain